MAEYNANGLDRGEQGSRSDMTLYLLCKHGCMRFPSGSPTVPHGESSLIKVIASPKNEEETFVASRAETRNGSGSSEGSGSLHPCWNQILELDMRGKGGQNFNGLHIDLIQEWGELKSKEQWVCGSATLGVPTDAQSVYDGWIPLKNGYGGTNGKITLSCSFDRNYIEALRMGLSPGAAPTSLSHLALSQPSRRMHLTPGNCLRTSARAWRGFPSRRVQMLASENNRETR
jgi:hypothetical protein